MFWNYFTVCSLLGAYDRPLYQGKVDGQMKSGGLTGLSSSELKGKKNESNFRIVGYEITEGLLDVRDWSSESLTFWWWFVF